MSRLALLTSSSTALLVAVVLAPVALLQSPQAPRRRGPEDLRKRSVEAETAGLAEPFKGITADGRIEPGLFGIHSTGVSTEPVRNAARAFLTGLTPAQRDMTTYAVDDDEWRKWMNQHFYVRQGVGFLEMTEAQREKAFALLRASLSAKGLKQTRDIMRLNETLAELNDGNFDEYGEWRYHITVMGAPSATEPWGWQFDGHHANINYFVLGDQVVMTPFFAGSEPVIAHSGKYKGVSVLQEEQSAGLAMINALGEAQRHQAILKFAKTGNENLTEAWKDNVVLDYAGVRATELSEAQRRQLLDLVALYVDNGDDGHARVKMEEVRKHLNRTWFAWIGRTEPGSVFYYRIHSPVILIEFDHQSPANLRHLAKDPNAPNPEHVHTIVRTPNGNDYGKDLLRRHYETHPHHAKDRRAPLPAGGEEEVGWSANGRDVQGTRYLPATEITRENVARLEVAWTYRTGEAEPRFATAKPTAFEATPLVVDGTMYVGTPLGRVIALDPATGRERWVYDPQIKRDVTYGDFASRGVSSWLDESAPADSVCRRRIFVATAQSQLIALDARDGRPCAAFGTRGIVDLTAGLRIPPFEPAAYSMTSPPVVVNGVVVTGSSVADNTRPESPSGEVRGYDARTGALKWSWDPVPQDPADPAHGQWRGTLAHKSGGANAWSVLAADPERDLVFVPTGSAAPDYYGVLRLGDNRYANSIVALKASTGKVVWAFQTVHHDLWDYDNASPPALVTITRDGNDVPAVLQATKTGMLFVLHRETGRPVFPVEERKVPASDVPLEEASPTQPFTVATPPLSPHRLAPAEVWGPTEADRAACREVIDGLRNEGIFTPPSPKGTLVLPSNVGGAHWGGVAVDPVRQIAFVPVNRIAAMVQLIPREGFDLQKARAEDQRLGTGYEYNGMWGTPYVMRRRILRSPSGLPCTPPPFGTLVAVDLKTGARRWEVPLGSFTRRLTPEQAANVSPAWGSVNLGGPIVTAGGVVFIGAALDRWLHAFDIETGRELWRGPLPESGKATPMSYRLASGEQFVVISVGGGGAFGTGDSVVAFRLRK
jgi:quinoprotein glucose dehydrogenase